MVFYLSFFVQRFCKDQSAWEQWWPGINITQKLEIEKLKIKELGWRLVLYRAPCRTAKLQQGNRNGLHPLQLTLEKSKSWKRMSCFQ